MKYGKQFIKSNQEISKELQRIRVQRDQYLHVTQAYADLNELIDLFAQDESELQKIAHDIKQLTKTIASFKIALLLNDPQDSANCFLNINAGAGPRSLVARQGIARLS